MATPIRTRGKRSRAVNYPIDDLWRATVRRRMEELGINQAELARRIEAVPASVTLIFQPDTVCSGFVPQIHKVLGFRAPGPTKAIEALPA